MDTAELSEEYTVPEIVTSYGNDVNRRTVVPMSKLIR